MRSVKQTRFPRPSPQINKSSINNRNTATVIWFLAGAGDFSLRHLVQTNPGIHPYSCPKGIESTFLAKKATRPWSWSLDLLSKFAVLVGSKYVKFSAQRLATPIKGLPQSLHANSGIVTTMRPQPISSIYFQIFGNIILTLKWEKIVSLNWKFNSKHIAKVYANYCT